MTVEVSAVAWTTGAEPTGAEPAGGVAAAGLEAAGPEGVVPGAAGLEAAGPEAAGWLAVETAFGDAVWGFLFAFQYCRAKKTVTMRRIGRMRDLLSCPPD